MTFFPSTLAAQLRRRSTACAALGLLGVLLLTGCEAPTAEQDGTPVTDPGTSSGGVQQQIPEPTGNQLSHDEMREQLESRYPDAALSDTTDYWAGLRDIETELQRLVVDPPECKQFVVRSAVPVPAGALVAYADETAEPAEEDPADPDAEGGEGAEQEGTENEGAENEGVEEEGAKDEGAEESDPEAGASNAGARIQLASTEEEDSESESESDEEAEGDGDSADEGDGESGDGDSGNGDSADGDSADGDSAEEESEPVTVDLPAERQAVIYSFRDWRAADAHLAAERDGLQSCDSYTASRDGEDSVETSTSVDTVDVDSATDEALGTTRRISSEDEREHSAAITLREGSQIVTVSVPLEDALSEDEAEVAVEELEAEAADLLESLD